MGYIRESKRLKVVNRSYQSSGKFGQLTHDLGLVETDKIKKAMLEQQRLKQTAGQAPKLGRLMVERGYLEREAAIEVLSLQKRLWIQCPRCGGHVSKLAFRERGQAKCRGCNTLIKSKSALIKEDETKKWGQPVTDIHEYNKPQSTKVIKVTTENKALEPIAQPAPVVKPKPVQPAQRVYRRQKPITTNGTILYRIGFVVFLAAVAIAVAKVMGIIPDTFLGN